MIKRINDKNFNINFIKKIILIALFFIIISCDRFDRSNKELSGQKQVVIKVFSSLTCPHCADFHLKIINEIKKDYIDPNLVKFEHISFPLDLAALNAEKVLSCITDKEKNFQFLGLLYKNQSKWASGSDINTINISIKKIGKEFGLRDKNMDECLNDENIQDQILDKRINAQKAYKIESTPTIFINEKKYKGKHSYKIFKKELDKILK